MSSIATVKSANGNIAPEGCIQLDSKGNWFIDVDDLPWGVSNFEVDGYSVEIKKVWHSSRLIRWNAGAGRYTDGADRHEVFIGEHARVKFETISEIARIESAMKYIEGHADQLAVALTCF